PEPAGTTREPASDSPSRTHTPRSHNEVRLPYSAAVESAALMSGNNQWDSPLNIAAMALGGIGIGGGGLAMIFSKGVGKFTGVAKLTGKTRNLVPGNVKNAAPSIDIQNSYAYLDKLNTPMSQRRQITPQESAMVREMEQYPTGTANQGWHAVATEPEIPNRAVTYMKLRGKVATERTVVYDAQNPLHQGIHAVLNKIADLEDKKNKYVRGKFGAGGERTGDSQLFGRVEAVKDEMAKAQNVWVGVGKTYSMHLNDWTGDYQLTKFTNPEGDVLFTDHFLAPHAGGYS
ncbi:hypothetical protein, partial [Streptomyces sp. NPDC057910]|uniref:hypothetical protein n=1 Tax=Streptomyces sp. NPDC057910 TaxID=3346278 RepID=UPI0036E475E6